MSIFWWAKLKANCSHGTVLSQVFWIWEWQVIMAGYDLRFLLNCSSLEGGG